MTEHAIKRGRERARLNRNATIKLIERATVLGKRATDFPKMEREYMQQKGIFHDSDIIYFGGYLFAIAHDGTCKTILFPPSWFGKKNYFGKEKIKNKRIYSRMYAVA